MSKQVNFLQGYLDGRYLEEEIDDFIDRWHEEKPAAKIYEYLGFSKDEWDLWVMDPSIFGQIALAHQAGISIEEQLERANRYALAARSENPVESERIINWLKKKGHA